MRKLVFVVVLSLASGLLFAGAGSGEGTSETESNLNPSGFPIVKEPITLKFLTMAGPEHGPFDELLVHKRYEEMTNIDIEWDQVLREQMMEKINLVVASDDLPDAFFKARPLSAFTISEFAQQGVVVPIDDLIADYAPNFAQIVADEPSVEIAIRMADGRIYSFPTVDFVSQIGLKMFFNKNWLDAVGMDFPTTTDEFYDVMRAFKQNDPNQNGKQDEIPWLDMNWLTSIWVHRGAWGLGNRGQHNFDVDPETGDLRYYSVHPRYKEVLEYVKRLYDEQLIDPEIFTQTWAKAMQKGNDNLVGCITFINHNIGGQASGNNENFESIPEPLVGPYGDQLWTAVRPPTPEIGSLLITKANRYPEATARWVDYFYTEEGSTLYFAGFEGETFEYEENGDVRITADKAAFSSSGYGADPVLHLKKTKGGGAVSPISWDATLKMRPFTPEVVFPQFIYTPEEREELQLYGDIDGYVQEMKRKFLTGEAPLSEWDNYVETVYDMGLEEYLALNEKVYARMKAGIE